jgi:hypothetical protein
MSVSFPKSSHADCMSVPSVPPSSDFKNALQGENICFSLLEMHWETRIRSSPLTSKKGNAYMHEVCTPSSLLLTSSLSCRTERSRQMSNGLNAFFECMAPLLEDVG